MLVVAQKLLREQLLVVLPDEHKHNALMIANAMGVAIRQMQAGEAAQHEECRSLERLLQRPLSDPSQVNSGNRELSMLLRAGLADPGQAKRTEVLNHLRRAVRQAVTESNPKYLT
ncbi:DUF6285 domain-containing protein [Pseudomonas sp. GD03860]|uniref:DUF6285 domain-containing protein n=1 Tax=Pseudomonas TaxID=286 RepID=UPI002363A772|nr:MULTISPECIES: DUF6285 domain-containing protein [Pseudomonas]MDD2058385.1 DUF6285 domain-containing protein [Pseudomonas putida]MDH0636315.1 DUF6285 domain-containing protein [Pseudomonas sp. GD03860]